MYVYTVYVNVCLVRYFHSFGFLGVLGLELCKCTMGIRQLRIASESISTQMALLCAATGVPVGEGRCTVDVGGYPMV